METLRTSVRLVQVDVVVHDKNGPVANLSKDDFILTDRGRRRPINVFSVETGSAPGEVVEPLPQNTFSNRQNHSASSRNVTIVLFDGLNTRVEDQVYAKQEIIKFLKSVDPKDRVAIYTLNSKLRVLCDFTDSPEQLQKVLRLFAHRRALRAQRDGACQYAASDAGSGGCGC